MEQNYLKQRLKAEIARFYWGLPAFYQMLLASDQQFKKASQYFDRAKALLKNEN